MSKCMRYIIYGCITFIFSCLFYLLFSYLIIFPTFDEEALIHMFFVSLGIISLIALINLLKIQSLILLHFLQIIIVMSVLFLAGIILNMFPLNWYYSGFVMMTGLFTYIIVILISFLNNRASARKINAVIRTKARLVQHE